MKVKFHTFYYTTSNPKVHLPFATICVIDTPEGTGIGISICADNDQFVTKDGENRSRGRAIAALKHKRNLFPIMEFYRMQKINGRQNLALIAKKYTHKGIFLPLGQNHD